MLGLAVLLAWGALTSGLERTRGAEVAFDANPSERLLSGMGAVRSFVADWSWLQANAAWEARDTDGLRGWLRLTIAAEPDASYFRVNAARMLAFDLPSWRSEQEHGAPEAVRNNWRRTGAEEAIACLLNNHRQESAELLIEAGNIAWRAGGDRVIATAFYRRAALQSDAPWHAGRIYARLLEESGRPREALAWLRSWQRERGSEMPQADGAILAERIALLERDLAGEDF
jgi:hypothetical protein